MFWSFRKDGEGKLVENDWNLEETWYLWGDIRRIVEMERIGYACKGIIGYNDILVLYVIYDVIG